MGRGHSDFNLFFFSLVDGCPRFIILLQWIILLFFPDPNPVAPAMSPPLTSFSSPPNTWCRSLWAHSLMNKQKCPNVDAILNLGAREWLLLVFHHHSASGASLWPSFMITGGLEEFEGGDSINFASCGHQSTSEERIPTIIIELDWFNIAHKLRV